MANTTTLEPKTTTDSVTNTTSVTDAASTSTATTPATPTALEAANSVFNKELMKRYGIGIISVAIAIFAFVMYRRGSWTRPILVGMVMGAAILAIIQSILFIKDTTKAKNALNA